MINYKHLHYFWVVAKQGGIARAGEQLHLTPQTISGQVNLLEELGPVDVGAMTREDAEAFMQASDELERPLLVCGRSGGHSTRAWEKAESISDDEPDSDPE